MSNNSDEELDTEGLILSCLSIGLTFGDFLGLKIGTIMDILIEKINHTEMPQAKGVDTIRDAKKGEKITSFF